MESRLVKLKSDFNNVINVRNSVKNVFEILQIRINRLSQIYAEFIKNNRSELFVFGLDSFHFQSKLIDIEYDDMKRLFLAISNRMYCEYFKLHKMIVEYISESINDKKHSDHIKVNNFPVYKDLEPYKEYKFEIILDIHENILNLLGVLISILNNKENELSIHETKKNIGLNIDNFITSFNFNINVMREKIIMFIAYVEFFHKMHSKYLKRFSNKIQLMYTHINNDIKFDDSVEISKNKKKELIDDFMTNNVDKNLLRELKVSIGSETNSEVSSEGGKSNGSPYSFTVENVNNMVLNQYSKNNLINDEIIGTEKKDLKKIFQKNVHKVTNILQLCKPKNNKVFEPKISNEELDNMFYGIEQSCDQIINNNSEHSTMSRNNTISTDIIDYCEQPSENIQIIYDDKNNDIFKSDTPITNLTTDKIVDEKPNLSLILPEETNKETIVYSDVTPVIVSISNQKKKKNKKKKK